METFIRSLLAVFTFCMLSSCASIPQTPKHALHSEFNADQARRMLEKGTNTIKGSALMRQRGGGVVTCAGQTVFLIPATAYAVERMHFIYGPQDRGFGGKPGQLEDNSLYVELTRRTRCDAQGFFAFDQVADGMFYVMTRINWETGRSAEGGGLMHRVTLSGVETREIVLAP